MAGGPPKAKPSVLGLPPVSIRKLYTFATCCDLVCVVLGCLMAGAAGCILPLFSLIFGKCINTLNDPTFTTAQAVDQISTFALWFFLIAIGAGVLTWSQVLLMGVSTTRQIRQMRAAYCRNLLRLDFEWYDTHRGGEAVSRLAEAIKSVSDGLKKVAAAFSTFATLICGFTIGFCVSWKLTLVIAACAPLFAIALSVLIFVAVKGQKSVRFAYARAGDVADEVISLQRAVSAYGGEPHELRRFATYVAMAEKSGIWQGRGLGLAVGIMLTVFMAMYGISCWAGANFVVQSRQDNPECRYNPTRAGCFSGGDIITTFVSVLTGALSLGQIGPQLGEVSAARAAAADLFGVIDAQPAVDVYDDSPELHRGNCSKADAAAETETSAPKAVGLKIEFRNVTFAYPSRPDVEVLSNFSLTISPGESIGVVGQSGSGKSTLVLLVMRAYDPKKGEVYVDGVDVRKWHLPSLRNALGLVQQEPVLFGCSIWENIAMGVANGTACSADVEKAAKNANAHDFIMQLPNAYETLAGTSVSSSQLSGGQRQRICIARALIRSPRIMLLDEATSALDTASERTVQVALDSAGAKSSATTLIIAHRLSTLANVHRIVVMERGVIVEEGSPSQLSTKEGGLFRAMKEAQEISDPSKGGTLALAKGKEAEASNAVETVSVLLNKTSPATVSLSPSKEVLKAPRRDFTRRLLRMQSDDWMIGLFGLIIAPSTGCIQPCVSLVYGGVITVFFNPDDNYVKTESLKYLGYFFCVAAAYLVGVTARQSTFTYLGERLTRKLREASFRSILRQSGGFFDDSSNSVGRLTTRLATDAPLVKGISGDALGSSLEGVGALTAALAIAFVNSWRLALVLMSVFPFLVVGAIFEFRNFAVVEAKGNNQVEEANQLVSECVTAARAVAAYGLQPRTLASYEKALMAPFRTGIRAAFITATGQSFQKFMLMVTYSLCFYVGSRLINAGTLTFNELIKTFLAVTLAAEAVGRITSMAPDTAAATLAATSIFDMIDAGDAVAIDPLATTGFQGAVGATGGLRIEYRNVSFAYPSRPDVVVLQNFHLLVEPGECVGVVGQSGSGKSTLVLLAMRVYDPQEGEVLVDDVNVKDWNVAALRRALGLVQQEPALFADSISYNIGYGVASAEKPAFGKGVQPKETGDSSKNEAGSKGKEKDAKNAKDALEHVIDISNIQEEDGPEGMPQGPARLITPDDQAELKYGLTPPEVIEAAGKANATQFIGRLPDGFATFCGSRGSLLSGGQKQRVAIARALLRSPRALLLDEATAALDSQSEKQVQAALDRVIALSRDAGSKVDERTTLVIAHRLSTLANADRIVVLERGRLVEQGPHDKLMQIDGGKYRALAQAQGSH